MTAEPSTTGIPAVGTVTETAGTELTEQLAAGAAFSRDPTAGEDDWISVFSSEDHQLAKQATGLDCGGSLDADVSLGEVRIGPREDLPPFFGSISTCGHVFPGELR
jgi:hypothetical protein